MDGDLDDKELEVGVDAAEDELDLSDEDVEEADDEGAPEDHGFTVTDDTESEWA